MTEDYAPITEGMQAAPQISAALRQRLAVFVAPLVVWLDTRLDARLVRTFVSALEAIVCFRHRNHGLLLSELGGVLLGGEHAPAGTKRLSNLLRSSKWTSSLLETFLWRLAETRREQLSAANETALVLGEESVIEKNESRKRDGLCPVRSSKAKRCLSVKPGFYRPPTTNPVFVPGMHWVGLLLCGLRGVPTLVCLRWWSSRGEGRTSARRGQTSLLTRRANIWGASVLHVFDRGYPGSPWLGQLLSRELRFVIRWQKRYFLHTADGKRLKTWQVLRGKKTQDTRQLCAARRQTYRTAGVVWAEVRPPDCDPPLWLVASRPGKGVSPWYLLTSERIESSDDARRIGLASARRGQIEMAFRYSKSELAFESPRLQTWERQVKLLLRATLGYAFLLSLLERTQVCHWLLRQFCHRTGKRSQQLLTPLYRLRTALSRLWMSYPQILSQTPG